MKGKIFIFSAPSGAGKNTLINKILSRYPLFSYSISATTRTPRQNEKDGVDYYFKTKSQFMSMIKNGELIEHEIVHGNYYGTPKSSVDFILKKGKNVIMDIDVKGKLKVDKVYPDSISIFIKTSSIEELERRLRLRALDTRENIALRIKNAEQEITLADKKGNYNYILINDVLNTAVKKLFKIIEKNI
ncbi:MAG: guanylate kinase [bacterium]